MFDTTTDTTIEVTRHRGVPVVAMSGEIDSTTVPPIRSRFFAELDRRPRGLVLDLTGVSFMGSTGLQVLVEGCTRAKHLGVTLVVAAGHRLVLRPLELTGLDREITLRGSVDEAASAVLRG